MKRSTLLVLLSVAAVLVIAVGLDAVFNVGQNPYLASLVATFAGVLAALPFALYLDRLQQTREEHVRAAEANAAAARALETERQRVSEVLGLLRGELAENEKMLDVRRDTPWDVHPPFLRSDVWHALNASSATVGISAELIQQMARAYYFVEATALIEQETFRLSLDPMVRTIQWASVEAAGAGPSPLTAARNELSRTDGATRQAIHEAVLAMTVATDR